MATIVWQRFGNVDNYVEPFAGSLAVLLGRPGHHRSTVETVNDKDRYICNFFRALQAEPDEVAKYADLPVNECDLTARHVWLVNEGRERMARLEADPEFYDAKVAGWWVWGICCWIGGSWCSGNGPWTAEDGKLVKGTGSGGVRRQLVHLGDAGQGVNRKRVHLGDAGQGVNRQRVHLGDAGQGVNRQRVHLGTPGRGVNRKRVQQGGGYSAGQGYQRKSMWESGSEGLYEYMRALAERLRHVRVCCGDWARVVTDGALSYGETVGAFLDPPYSQEERDPSCYVEDEAGLALAVRQWALDHSDTTRYRIALCGYEGEYEMPDDWECYAWTANASYKTHRGDLTQNRYRERIWFSPGCLNPAPRLFETDDI